MRAGHCAGCGRALWRIALAQKDSPSQGIKAEQPFLLWPLPDSVYARVRTPEGNLAVGIAFCEPCAPAVGQPWGGTSPQLPADWPVHAYESALTRYTDWYHPNRRDFYAAWLSDALFYTADEIEVLLTQWDTDRQRDNDAD